MNIIPQSEEKLPAVEHPTLNSNKNCAGRVLDKPTLDFPSMPCLLQSVLFSRGARDKPIMYSNPPILRGFWDERINRVKIFLENLRTFRKYFFVERCTCKVFNRLAVCTCTARSALPSAFISFDRANQELQNAF